jgi:hypothetical protein
MILLAIETSVAAASLCLADAENILLCNGMPIE